MQQQVVLRKEPRKQQSVPLFVREFHDQQQLGFFTATELAPLRSETVAKRSLVVAEVIGPPISEYAEAINRSPYRVSEVPARAASTADSSCLRRAEGERAHPSLR